MPAIEATSLRSPAEARRRADRLLGKREEREARSLAMAKQFADLRAYLEISGEVTRALEELSNELFKKELLIVSQQLTTALQEILDQPLKFTAKADFKHGAAAVEFGIERDGNEEDVERGQGGSVHNILSVGLRIFALATLDPARHRRFLVLDEQDCWLRPDLVPKLVKMVRDAGKKLGFQVLMISHHDVAIFERYADKIYQFTPAADGSVSVRELAAAAARPDSSPLPVEG